MGRLISMLSLAALLAPGTSWAQLPAPNEAGVTMVHIHLHVQDIEANKKFWTVLGGTPAPKLAGMEVIKFPGILILMKKADSASSSVEAVVHYWGYKVPNLQATMKKLEAAGMKTAPGPIPGMGFAISPDDIRIEIFEDASMTTPIAMRNLSFFVAEEELPKIQAWYVKIFGGKPGMRMGHLTAQVAGASLTFIKSSGPAAPTKGRVLDHIGFDIQDLEAFCKKLEASGVKLDQPYRKLPGGPATAWLTDPWGTYIELTEGLNKI